MTQNLVRGRDISTLEEGGKKRQLGRGAWSEFSTQTAVGLTKEKKNQIPKRRVEEKQKSLHYAVTQQESNLQGQKFVRRGKVISLAPGG